MVVQSVEKKAVVMDVHWVDESAESSVVSKAEPMDAK